MPPAMRWATRPVFISHRAHALDGADALLPGIDADTISADKAFDADARVIQPLQQAGTVMVIPPNPTEHPHAKTIKTATEHGI